jgi:hypothetical protein
MDYGWCSTATNIPMGTRGYPRVGKFCRTSTRTRAGEPKRVPMTRTTRPTTDPQVFARAGTRANPTRVTPYPQSLSA